MGKRKVKEHSAEFKIKVVLEVLKESQTQAEIASSSTIPSWAKHFLGNAEKVFQSKQMKKNHNKYPYLLKHLVAKYYNHI